MIDEQITAAIVCKIVATRGSDDLYSKGNIDWLIRMPAIDNGRETDIYRY